MTSVNDAAKLSHAVLANSRDLVDMYLEQGTPPDIQLGDVIPCIGDVAKMGADGAFTIPDHILVTKCNTLRCGAPTALHLAVINCYQQGRSNDVLKEDKASREEALGIVRSLLRSGANTSTLAPNMVVYNVPGFMETGIILSRSPAGVGTDSLDLAAFLKKHCDNESCFKSEQAYMMDSVIRELVEASSSAGTPSVPTVTVPKSAAVVWEKLLLSEDFSDVHFVCADGVTLHAHRNVLAAASPYFCTVFKGPWKENHEGGKWVTSHKSELMKAVLGFIYTGKVDSSLIDTDPQGMLSVSSEYDLDDLKQQSEATCVRNLSVGNVKETLQIAHLHSSARLKKACFGFVQKNAARILADPAMMSLPNEDAELWNELTDAIAPAEADDEARTAKRRRAT